MKLVCLGANNPETIRQANAIRELDPDFELLGFVDNDQEKWGTTFFDLPVFGGMDRVAELNRAGVLFCNVITRDCVTRYETTLGLVEAEARLTNFIHPNVTLDMVDMGLGNYIQEGAIVQAEVKIGDNSSISMGSLINHETKIGSSVFIAPGVTLSGIITVEDGVFIGAGATVLPRLSLGKWSVIGAGSVITRDVPAYSVVVGNPGRVIGQTGISLSDGKVVQERD